MPKSVLAPLLTVTALLPLTPAPAAVVLECTFDTAGDTENWEDLGVGTGHDGLTSDGASLTATSPGLDPQLGYGAALSRAADAAWGAVEFRVRETETAGGDPVAFDPTGVVIQINGGGKEGLNLSKPGAFSATEDGDGFYLVTAPIAGYAGETIDKLRIDPIGGSLKNSNSDTAGNTWEIDFIRVTDTAAAEIEEPG